MTRPGAQACRDMLAWNHDLAGEISGDGFHMDAFMMLQNWQRSRLSETYSDLMERDSERPACEFFLDELYGGLDFLKRDQDLDRVMPVMVRFLPDSVLYSMAEAFELQAMSLEFDIGVSKILERDQCRSLDLEQYARAYRECNDRKGRERQILLIRQLGHDLSKLVNKAFVSYLVRLLRGPAHAAGFGQLQSFLETGLDSFRQLSDAMAFTETVYRREWDAMERLFAMEEDPYRFAARP